MPAIERNFGLLIAFILPGFVALTGVGYFSPMISSWMTVAPQSDPTVGGFLYVALGSLAAGMVTSAFRWLLIDTAFHRTGLTAPKLDFGRLQNNLAAYELAVEHNYRHYQFYANMIPATVFFAVANQMHGGVWRFGSLFCWFVLEVVLGVTARDCLRRFYQRTAQVLAAGESSDAAVTASPAPVVSQSPAQNPED